MFNCYRAEDGDKMSQNVSGVYRAVERSLDVFSLLLSQILLNSPYKQVTYILPTSIAWSTRFSLQVFLPILAILERENTSCLTAFFQGQ